MKPGAFVKRPVRVEAMRLSAESPNDVLRWLLSNGVNAGVRAEGAVDIATLEGTMRADVGDWVIRGVQGEFYPCKPDIFEQTYEAVR